MGYLKAKSLLKKLTENKDVNSAENIINNERTDKAPSGQKRVFIIGDSSIKHKWLRNLRKTKKLQSFC